MYNALFERHVVDRLRGKSKKKLVSAFVITFVGTFILLCIGGLLIAALNPEYYSVITLNKQKRYLIEKGDFLLGKAIPNSKVKGLIVSKTHKYTFDIDVQKNGSWSYKLPNTIASGRYVTRIANYDSKNIKVFSKLYRFRVASSKEYVSYKSKISRSMPFKIGDVLAQTGEGGDETSDEDTPIEAAQSTGGTNNQPEVLSIKITDIGLTNYAYLVPGGAIQPDVVVSSNLRTYLTDDESLSLKWFLTDRDGQQQQPLTSLEDCTGARRCRLQVPEGLNGEYRLVVELHNQGADESAAIASDMTDVIVKPADQQQMITPVKDTDSQIPGQVCLGEICPVQPQATVVSLDDLYITDSDFSALDGSARNIISDCGENCVRPLVKINQSHLQTGFNLDSFNNENQSELVSCLKETQTNPSSSLSLVAGIAMLEEAYLTGNLGGINQNDTLKDFFSTSSFNCSLDSLTSQSLTEFNQIAQSFKSVKRHDNASFEAVEQFYQENKYPILVETKFNQNSSHYGLVTAITDKYVWLVDPLDPNKSGFVLRITKDDFKNSYFNGGFWEILPNEGILGNFKLSTGSLGFLATPGSCIARGKIFFETTGGMGGEPVPIPGFPIDIKNNIARDVSVNLRKYVTKDEDICILGKFVPTNEEKTNQYVVTFDKSESLKEKGYFAVPIAKIIVKEGSVLQPNARYRKNLKIGARINSPDSSSPESIDNLFNNFDQLGLGVVRISLDNASPETLTQKYKLIDQAIDRGYFIVLQYQLKERPHRSSEWGDPRNIEGYANLSNFDFDVEITRQKLDPVLKHLKDKGLSANGFAFELGNEPNIQWDKNYSQKGGKYFNDCAKFVTDAKNPAEDSRDKFLGDENSGPVFIRDSAQKVQITDLDLNSAKCNVAISEEHFINIYYAFADFINSTSTAIWSLEPDTKIIIGAIYTAYGNDVQERYNRQFNWLYGAIEVAVGKQKFGKLDFAIHGYDKWRENNDGIEVAFDALTNNQVFARHHNLQDGCNCVWATEFGIDQEYQGQYIYQMQEAFQALANNESIKNNLRSLVIHEFNGGVDPDQPHSIFQLYSETGNLHYPLFNLVQYLNLFSDVQTANILQ